MQSVHYPRLMAAKDTRTDRHHHFEHLCKLPSVLLPIGGSSVGSSFPVSGRSAAISLEKRGGEVVVGWFATLLCCSLHASKDCGSHRAAIVT